MPVASEHPTEAKRLYAVRSLRLVGTPAEERFDKIARLAKRVFNVPIAVIDLVDDKRVWLKSALGMDRVEVDRSITYCPTHDPRPKGLPRSRRGARRADV